MFHRVICITIGILLLLCKSLVAFSLCVDCVCIIITSFTAQIVRIDNIDFCTVLDVKCGLYHTVLITSTGLVLAWGDNSYGQLSFIDTKYERIARWGRNGH